jgi:hypothetical protein
MTLHEVIESLPLWFLDSSPLLIGCLLLLLDKLPPIEPILAPIIAVIIGILEFSKAICP